MDIIRCVISFIKRYPEPVTNLVTRAHLFFAENQQILNASKSELIPFCQKNDTNNVASDRLPS